LIGGERGDLPFKITSSGTKESCAAISLYISSAADSVVGDVDISEEALILISNEGGEMKR
jgi:predicted transcriptional regulator